MNQRAMFVFGRTPDLAFAELTSFYPDAVRIHPSAATVESFDGREMLSLLGGTVKVAGDVSAVPEIRTEVIVGKLTGHVRGSAITFGISTWGEEVPKKISHDVKEALMAMSLRVRYVEPKHGSELSSVVVGKQDVAEVVIIKTGHQYLMGITRQVQDFEQWNRRDYGRPYPDPKAGMLPPKVARMIANIALRRFAARGKLMNMTLLDPFCGVGTVPAEGLLAGADVTGSDLSPEAIGKARRNIAWLRQAYPEAPIGKASFIVSDATHLSQHIPSGSIDAIATEPFMGDPSLQLMADRGDYATKVKNTLKGLEKLYIGSLKDWSGILKPGGRVVMALPQYVVNGRTMDVKSVIDRCENLGYTLQQGPIEYARPQAVVKRMFYVLQKINT